MRNNFVPARGKRENSPRRAATATDKSVLAREKLQTFQSRTSSSARVCYLLDKVSTRRFADDDDDEDDGRRYETLASRSVVVVSCNLTWSINAPNY